MEGKRIFLKKENREVYLLRHASVSSQDWPEERPAMLILPGGAYSHISKWESLPVADYYASQGFACYVLYYSLREEASFETLLEEVALSMAQIKRESKRYGFDAERVLTLGFSAGAHLAAMLGNLWFEDAYFPEETTAGERRPCAQIFSYGYYSFDGTAIALRSRLDEVATRLPESLSKALLSYINANRISRDPKLLGDPLLRLTTAKEAGDDRALYGIPGRLGMSRESWDRLRPALLNLIRAGHLPMGDVMLDDRRETEIPLGVHPLTPPTFAWHAADDRYVPAIQLGILQNALLNAGVAVETHLFDRGGHGMALSHLQDWRTPLRRWLEARGFWPGSGEE